MNFFCARAANWHLAATAVPSRQTRPGSDRTKIAGKEEWLSLDRANYVLRHEMARGRTADRSQHSRQLAALFRKEMQRERFPGDPNSAACSIVVVTDVPGNSNRFTRLEHHHVKCPHGCAGPESVKAGLRYPVLFPSRSLTMKM